MPDRRIVLPFVLAASIVATAIVTAPAAGASTGLAGSTSRVSASGTTSYRPNGSAADTGITSRELGPSLGDGGSAAAPGAATGGSSAGTSGTDRSKTTEKGDSSSQDGGQGGQGGDGRSVKVLNSFDGLNHRAQRLANGGNQFSVEPPDQGLCAGNGVVMEIINDVMRVYSSNGTPLKGVEDLNTFFGYAAQFNRTTGEVGPFVTDPSCYYDKSTNRWFADVLTLDTFPATGDFTGQNHLDLAVSNTGDPTGSWTIYRVQVQDDGNNGTPNHNCTGLNPPMYGNPNQAPTYPNACLGDYPHLGADANGVYLTTNEYSFFGNDFHGAQVYAFAKSQLVEGSSSVNVTRFDTHGAVEGNSGFTVWPAVAPAGLNSHAQGGTEYFLSSNAADEAHGNGVNPGPRTSDQLLVWSLTNTSSLKSDSPELELSHVTLSVGRYSVPVRSEQKVGPTPLADCLNNAACSTMLAGFPDPFKESEYPIDSNDTRMQQVVYANGKLWAALDTSIEPNSNTKAGIEWFIVSPSSDNHARLVGNGYLTVPNNNVIYPAVGVRPDGQGVIAFTLVGADYYPSAAFASISKDGVGNVQVAAAGAGPADGFSGTFLYNYPNPPRPRWGDYGAAVVDGQNIWIASEYIGQSCSLADYMVNTPASPFGSCNKTRTSLANWDTRITEVNPQQ